MVYNGNIFNLNSSKITGKKDKDKKFSTNVQHNGTLKNHEFLELIYFPLLILFVSFLFLPLVKLVFKENLTLLRNLTNHYFNKNSFIMSADLILDYDQVSDTAVAVILTLKTLPLPLFLSKQFVDKLLSF